MRFSPRLRLGFYDSFTPGSQVSTTFLRSSGYAGHDRNKSVRGIMDMIFLGAIVAFLLATCALAIGCDKLGKRQ
jgi:hypothetical protein